VGGVTTSYLVDTQSPTGYAQVIQENFSGGRGTSYELSHTYVYGLEQISERLYYLQNSNALYQTFYYVHDGHGSVRALTDPTGTVTDTYDYDAFGSLIHSTGTTPNNYLFASEQYDPDLSLYYNRARYLNTSSGRFWSMDTTEGKDETPSSLHKYLYCSGDPLNKSDQSGHDFSIAEALTVAIVVTVLAAIPTAHDSVSKTKVEVHFDEIPAFRRAHHAYLVLRDSAGAGIVFRGGPSLSGGCGPDAASKDASGSVGSSDDLGCGYLTEAGSGQPYGPGGPDYPREPGDDVASVVVPDVQKSFFELIAGFETDANNIESLHLPYQPVSQNSNSFAHTLLVKERLSAPSPPVWSPGWDKILY
jgi:RHS repeat-associated protein